MTVANGAGDGKWLKSGTYKDMVGGGAFTVNASTISGHVGESGIAVIYNAGPIVLTPEVVSILLMVQPSLMSLSL